MSIDFMGMLNKYEMEIGLNFLCLDQPEQCYHLDQKSNHSISKTGIFQKIVGYFPILINLQILVK